MDSLIFDVLWFIMIHIIWFDCVWILNSASYGVRCQDLQTVAENRIVEIKKQVKVTMALKELCRTVRGMKTVDLAKEVEGESQIIKILAADEFAAAHKLLDDPATLTDILQVIARKMMDVSRLSVVFAMGKLVCIAFGWIEIFKTMNSHSDEFLVLSSFKYWIRIISSRVIFGKEWHSWTKRWQFGKLMYNYID